MTAMLITFTVIAAIGGLIAGLVIMGAGALFYHNGFQFPVSFYGSIAIVVLSVGKYYLDREEYKPKPVEVAAPIPSPRSYRNGPLIVLS
jgi:hypothetical protein